MQLTRRETRALTVLAFGPEDHTLLDIYTTGPRVGADRDAAPTSEESVQGASGVLHNPIADTLLPRLGTNATINCEKQTFPSFKSYPVLCIPELSRRAPEIKTETASPASSFCPIENFKLPFAVLGA